MKKKKYEKIHSKRASDGGILVMNTYGELWSNYKIKVLKMLNFKN